MLPATFDATRFRKYPLSEVIADFARGHSLTLTVEGRAKYLAKIARLDELDRTLVLLETLRHGMGSDGLHTFLFLSSGDVAPEIVLALRAAGLEREAGLLEKALALFGPSYPADHRLREKLFGYWYGTELNAFDQRLLPIAAAFGNKALIGTRIEAFVRRTPALLQRMRVHRGTIPDEFKLRSLQLALWREVDIYGPVGPMQANLARLPDDYRLLLLIGLFATEFGNGGMEQLFFNARGALAPDMAAAFAALKLRRHAAVLSKAVAAFPAPYQRDTRRRRAVQSAATDEALRALTEEIYAIADEPSYQDAALAFARARGLLPR